MTQRRAIITNEGEIWHVRKVKTVTFDCERDHMVYRCDEPIKNNCKTFEEAQKAFFQYLEGDE